MVIDDVYHALHAARVYRGDELHEVRHAAVLGVHIAVIAVRVGTAEAAFPALEADGVDRHEPYNVRAEGLDTVKGRVSRRGNVPSGNVWFLTYTE